MQNILIIGAGAVAQAAAHKCAQNNDILGNICIASRTQSKCEKIIKSIKRKNNLKDNSKKLYSRQINAYDVPAMIRLIKETNSSIVINLGTAFINMSVLEACIEAGVSYMDTAIHEEEDRVATICENPPWYGNYEWKRKDRCTATGINAILGVGFDPGVVNAYAASAMSLFDEIDTIDILDVNAGSHGRYFATNFDPEINFREFTGKVWEWVDRQWVAYKTHEVKMVRDFPMVGEQTMYLTGHDELHSLSKNIKANTIRFWMSFSDHYINVFNVLNNIGLLSEKPVKTAEGFEIIPLKVVKACLPDPKSLAQKYTGKTCIGNLVKGTKDGMEKEVFIYNVCDHAECYKEVESQAISYTAGVPPVAAAILLAKVIWNPKTMVNVEVLDPEPFIKVLGDLGLPTQIIDYSKKLTEEIELALK
jgi:saccharopine dehydrogenase-like NADP-dependent oxidoreductase